MARDEIRRLESLLADTEFACIPDGVHHVHAIYRAVARQYPALCDDGYLCSQNCAHGHKTPEWQHAVRRALDRAKGEAGRIWKAPTHGQWGFGPGPSTAATPANVAFKLTWVYGDDGPWTSPCTPEGRRTNILKERKVWCRQGECKCSRLVHGEDRLPRSFYPCLDYRGPVEHCFASGTYHHGPRRGEPIPMVGTAVGKFAFLTSRRYGTQEWERVILSCFRIDRLGDIPRVGSHAVAASTDSPYTLRVPVDRLGHAPRFWDFRAAAEAQDWRTGLFRYVPDHEAAAMREAVAALCEGIDVPVWRDVDASRQEEEYVEGQRSARLVSYYERNPRLRSAAIRAHGTRCQACGFDFARRYGDLGAGFIEVHHLRPVAGYHAQVAVDPREDMRVVCPNCHRMIHRHPAQPLTVEQLRTILSSRRV